MLHNPSVFILLVLLVYLSAFNTVFAEPNEIASTRTTLEEEGYKLTVDISPPEPSVGTVLLRVKPQNAVTQEDITNAIILILMKDEQSDEMYQSYALNTPQNRLEYRANFLLKKPGLWTAVIIMSLNDKSTVTFNMSIEVKDRNFSQSKVGTVVWIIVILILFSGVSYVIMRVRRATPNQKSQG